MLGEAETEAGAQRFSNSCRRSFPFEALPARPQHLFLLVQVVSPNPWQYNASTQFDRVCLQCKPSVCGWSILLHTVAAAPLTLLVSSFSPSKLPRLHPSKAFVLIFETFEALTLRIKRLRLLPSSFVVEEKSREEVILLVLP